MTSKEFAKLVGVSQSTVSRAMNNSDLISEERRNYIQKMAVKHGFVLNSQARSLKTNRTNTIGIVFPRHFVGMHVNLGLSYMYDFVQKELRKYGYDVIVIYNSSDETGLSTFEKTIKSHKVDGFIVLSLDITRQELELVRQYDVPMVYLLYAKRLDEYNSSCMSDNEYCGYLAGQYFGQFKDYTCYYLEAEKNIDSIERRAGYRRGLAEQNVPWKDDHVFSCELSIRSAYECIIEHKNLFMSKKCAIFAYNDILAVGILSACRDLNLCVPERIQVIGVDNLPLCMDMFPELTSLQVFQDKIAEIGCDLLRKAVEDGDRKAVHIVVKPELVKGGTTL